jgi:hypothetical protein
MKLSATITELISGSEYDDSRRRIKLKVEGADSCFRSLIVPNGGLTLDDELVLLVLTKADAYALSGTLDGLQRAGQRNAIVDKVADQLRPDPPNESVLQQAMNETAHLDDVREEA